MPYYDPRQDGRDHLLVKISSSDLPEPVKAYLPDQFAMSVSSDWSAPFAGTSGATDAVLSLFGVSLKTKPLSAQLWGGSSPLELTIPMVFLAHTDPIADVLKPVVSLMKMALPSLLQSDTGLFKPPGPTFAEYLDDVLSQSKTYVQGKQKVDDLKKKLSALGFDTENLATSAVDGEDITINIGNFATFNKVVVTNVNPVFFTDKISKNDMPMKATVDLTFRTYTTPSKEDLDVMFNRLNVREVTE